MSLNKITIYIERNTKIEYRKYTIYKATLYLKTILLKNVFLYSDVSFSLKNQLGDVVYVDLPEEGQTFNEGGTIRR